MVGIMKLISLLAMEIPLYLKMTGHLEHSACRAHDPDISPVI